MGQKESIITVVLVLALCVFSLNSFAQPQEQLVKVIVAPDHSEWKYTFGEKAKFDVSIMQFGNLVQNVKVKYVVKPEKIDEWLEEQLLGENQ